MCGIVGVVRRRAQRTPPDPAALGADLASALGALHSSSPISERLAERGGGGRSRRHGAARRSRRSSLARCAERLGRARGTTWCDLARARRHRKGSRPRRRRCAGCSRDRARQLGADPGPGRGLVGSPRSSPRRRWRCRTRTGLGSGDRCLPVDLRRVVLARPPRGPRARFGWAARLRAWTRSRSRCRRRA